MGMIHIQTAGSFPKNSRSFSAMDHGHAHAVTDAIKFLANEVLPEAIERDHKLHGEGVLPRKGFGREKRKSD